MAIPLCVLPRIITRDAGTLSRTANSRRETLRLVARRFKAGLTAASDGSFEKHGLTAPKDPNVPLPYSVSCRRTFEIACRSELASAAREKLDL